MHLSDANHYWQSCYITELSAKRTGRINNSALRPVAGGRLTGCSQVSVELEARHCEARSLDRPAAGPSPFQAARLPALLARRGMIP